MGVQTEPIRAAITLLLMQRGWDLATLAKEAGLAHITARLQCSGVRSTPRSIRMIEKALETPIWTDRAHFDALNRASEAAGRDVVLTSLPELRQVAGTLGIQHEDIRMLNRYEAHRAIIRRIIDRFL